MALVSVRLGELDGGLAWASIDYDDVTNKVSAFHARNDTTFPVVATLRNPSSGVVIGQRTMQPGTGYDVAIPAGQQPTLQFVTMTRPDGTVVQVMNSGFSLGTA
jgi:hypothetical protein